MSSSFPTTMRSMASQSSAGARLLLVSAAALACGWAAWFVRARVPVYAASEHARLEVERATHPVDAQVTGRVVAARLALEAEGETVTEIGCVTKGQGVAYRGRLL